MDWKEAGKLHRQYSKELRNVFPLVGNVKFSTKYVYKAIKLGKKLITLDKKMKHNPSGSYGDIGGKFADARDFFDDFDYDKTMEIVKKSDLPARAKWRISIEFPEKYHMSEVETTKQEIKDVEDRATKFPKKPLRLKEFLELTK